MDLNSINVRALTGNDEQTYLMRPGNGDALIRDFSDADPAKLTDGEKQQVIGMIRKMTYGE